jgi:hypothetical protein
MHTIKENLTKKIFFIPFLLLIVFTIWRFYLMFYGFGNRSYDIQIWAASYQLMAWFGVICGFYLAGLWGGWKSLVGRASLAFAFGLLAQSFGQSVFSYFFYKGINTPYPSIADVGFFGSIPFYIYGAFLLVKFYNTKKSLNSLKNFALIFIIPIGMLLISYFIFLNGYQFDWSQPLKIILDFGYPLGQSAYVSLAILAFLLSLSSLGGIMKKPTLLFIFSLVAQYVADYTFLYKSNNGTFVGGGIVDYLYLIAYFLMAVSLIQLGLIFYRIKNS